MVTVGGKMLILGILIPWQASNGGRIREDPLRYPRRRFLEKARVSRGAAVGSNVGTGCVCLKTYEFETRGI